MIGGSDKPTATLTALTTAPVNLMTDMTVDQLIEAIQTKIDKAVADRDRATAARRIEAGIDVALINPPVGGVEIV